MSCITPNCEHRFQTLSYPNSFWPLLKTTRHRQLIDSCWGHAIVWRNHYVDWRLNECIRQNVCGSSEKVTELIRNMDSHPQSIVKNADMNEEMQEFAINTADKAAQSYSMEKDIASVVKKAFDEKYGPTWHAVVGKNYGRLDWFMLNNNYPLLFDLSLLATIPLFFSYVTHESGHFIYFYLRERAYLLFKSGWWWQWIMMYPWRKILLHKIKFERTKLLFCCPTSRVFGETNRNM